MATSPSAQIVGNAFVEQYYHILHQSPELVHRFYQNTSVVSRPEPNGVMTSVTTMTAINDKIMSLDYTDLKAEIKSVDAQPSYKDGVVVLVTGCLIGKDDVGKKFTQSFFLAPQDKGYFVLNDVFRYVDDNNSEYDPVLENGTSEITQTAPVTPEPEPSHVPDHPIPVPVTPIVEEELNNVEEVHAPLVNEEVTVEVERVVEELPVHSNQTEAPPVTEPAVPVVQEDAPKKSYASIVKVPKGVTPVYVPTGNARPAKPSAGKPVSKATPTAEQKMHGSAGHASAPVSSVAGSNNASESNNAHEEEGHSIYIKNLPLSAEASQVEEVFKKFGAIKLGGIQVRSNKGFCFGFVEFESLSSMEDAIKAGSVMISGRPVAIEEKRTTTRVGTGGRGRYPLPGRGGSGFRNDFRGRGNYGGGGRGYGRNDFGNRGDFAGRRGGSSGRGGEGGGYQRVDQNGSARGGRQGGMNQTAVAA